MSTFPPSSNRPQTTADIEALDPADPLSKVPSAFAHGALATSNPHEGEERRQGKKSLVQRIFGRGGSRMTQSLGSTQASGKDSDTNLIRTKVKSGSGSGGGGGG